MKITKSNYYSQKANGEYMSVSQYKDFMGTLGQSGCEAKALAKLQGKFQEENTEALLLGSFVDCYFEGKKSFAKFIAQNPDIALQSGKNKGCFKEKFQIALRAAQKAERDDLFCLYMSGKKQKIMTAELPNGIKFKIKIDSYHLNKCIVDLKYIKSIHERFWVKDYGFTNFVDYWGYDIQGAIYQYVAFLNTGKKLPFYIAAIDKQKEADFEIIQIDDEHLNFALEEVLRNVGKIDKLKKGMIEPIRCEKCDYCRQTKKLIKPISLSQLIEI